MRIIASSQAAAPPPTGTLFIFLELAISLSCWFSTGYGFHQLVHPYQVYQLNLTSIPKVGKGKGQGGKRNSLPPLSCCIRQKDGDTDFRRFNNIKISKNSNPERAGCSVEKVGDWGGYVNRK